MPEDTVNWTWNSYKQAWACRAHRRTECVMCALDPGVEHGTRGLTATATVSSPSSGAPAKAARGTISFAYAHYVGGHSRLGRGRQGNFQMTYTELGIGTIRPKVAVIRLADIANVEVVGGQVAKNKAGAVLAFGVLGLGAKSAKNEASIIVNTKDGETAYYTIDKQTPINVRAKITPILKSAGIPFAGEAAALPVPTAPGAASNLAQQIRDLGALRDEGLLTEEEFATQKAKLLGGA